MDYYSKENVYIKALTLLVFVIITLHMESMERKKKICNIYISIAYCIIYVYYIPVIFNPSVVVFYSM